MATSPWTPVDETSAWKPVKEDRPDFSKNPPSGVTGSHYGVREMVPAQLLAPNSDTLRGIAGKLNQPGSSPGVSDGPGLAEGLSEYDKAGFGQAGSGIADIAHGDFSRGAHKVIAGATNAAAPALALAAPALIAAPGATALAVGGGLAGGKIASKGAEALGATPDQATLAGDVGNLAGGYAGTKIPAAGQAAAEFAGPKVTALAKTAAQDAASHIPFAGRVVRRPSIGDYIDALGAKKAPIPDATPLNKPYAGEDFDKGRFKPAADATKENRPYAGEVAVPESSTPAVKTPSGLNAENAAHSNSFFEQVKSEHPEMSVSQQLMEAAKRENAPAKGIPGKPTVIPAPSSEAYKSSAPPLEARIPGPDEDMTALLSKSVDKVKTPVYDDETVAAAAKGLEEQGYNPQHIQQVLQKMGLGPKTGMNVDEVFSQYPPGDAVQPFAKERAAAIEAQGPEADAIKSKLTKLRNVKVPPSPAMTPEEIKARLLKFQR